jgi:hypothetical protein
VVVGGYISFGLPTRLNFWLELWMERGQFGSRVTTGSRLLDRNQEYTLHYIHQKQGFGIATHLGRLQSWSDPRFVHVNT